MDELSFEMKIVLFLILFFLSLLIYFIIFLIYSHYRYRILNRKKGKIKFVMANYLVENESIHISGKRLSSSVGIDALTELLEMIREEDIQKLRDYLNKVEFNKHIRKRLQSSNKYIKTYIIKLIGNLNLAGMEEIIQSEIYRNKQSVDIQYVGFEALAKLGCDDFLIQIFNDDSLENKLTYRALQNIFLVYKGDKVEFYRKMLEVKDEYVTRIIIKLIGSEGVYPLKGAIRGFLASQNKDMKVAVITSLGALEDKDCYQKIQKYCSDEVWEIRLAAIKAIAKIDLEESIDTLIKGLSDSQWWVRYHSAEALVHSKDIKKIRELVEKSGDPFSKDILNYGIEKRKMEKNQK